MKITYSESDGFRVYPEGTKSIVGPMLQMLEKGRAKNIQSRTEYTSVTILKKAVSENAAGLQLWKVSHKEEKNLS